MKQKFGTTVRDAVYGAAVGDALGVPFEFMDRDTFVCSGMVGHGIHNKMAGTWSDDTSMTLAICDSIRELGRVNVNDIRNKFEEWMYNDRYTVDGLFSIGRTTSMAIENGKGLDDGRSCGNGSLMRTIPLAFAPCSPRDVAEVSAITHANKTCTDICKEFVRVVWNLVEGIMSKSDLRMSKVYSSMDRKDVRSSGYVVDTYQAAMWCFANTDDYESCVLEAVNLGGDTDTTACVAGGLAGAYYGIDAIPGNWLSTLRGKDIIEGCLF